jgi:uncharacterized membrane protein
MSEEEHFPTEHHNSSAPSVDPRLSALLSYLFAFVGGIIFFATAKNSYVRFHAMQSILLSATFIVLMIGINIISLIIPFFVIISFDWILYLIFFAITVVMLIKAYQGSQYKLPILGDLAEKFTR